MVKVKTDGRLLLPFLQVVTDIIAIEGAFLLSYWLRFHSPLTSVFPVVRGIPSLSMYVVSSWAVILLWLLIMKAGSLYGVRRNASKADELAGIMRCVTYGMIIAAAATFFYRGFSYSRLVFVYIWFTSIVLLAFTRLTIISFERAMHRSGRGLVRGAIAGSSRLGADLLRIVRARPGLGIEIAGYIGDRPVPGADLPRLGTMEETGRLIGEEGLGIIFISLAEDENTLLPGIVNMCTGLSVEFYLVPDILSLMTSRLRILQIEGIPLLKIKDTAITGWGSVFKRGFDILFSGLSLILLSPFFLVISLAIKAGSRGPVFYRQERIGLDGRGFDLLKFRSMREDAENGSGPVWTRKGDRRVTAVGRLLRRFSLDELPQLVNVFRGEMSLVGPRPERPHFVDQFKERIPKYLERHRVRSGMTGWAQVNGLRGDVPIEDRTKYDVYYVENWSFLFDLRIMAITVWTVIRGENSY